MVPVHQDSQSRINKESIKNKKVFDAFIVATSTFTTCFCFLMTMANCNHQMQTGKLMMMREGFTERFPFADNILKKK